MVHELGLWGRLHVLRLVLLQSRLNALRAVLHNRLHNGREQRHDQHYEPVHRAPP
jgi:hypothetical protein